MRSPIYKSVKELYDKSLSESKITPDLKRNCLIQGPVNKVNGAHNVMELSEPGCIDDVYCTTDKPKESEKSRKFNASSTLCKHVAVNVGEKDDNFLTEADKRKGYVHNSSYGCDVLSSSINSTCNVRLTTSSDLCSSHNSFSENAESKAGLGVSDLSEDIEMLTSTGQSFSENSYRHKEKKNLGDCVSLTAGSRICRKVIGHRIGEAVQKNVSCGPSMDNSVPSMKEVFDDMSEKKEASSDSTLTHLGNISNQASMYSKWQGSKSVKLDPAMMVRNIAAENPDRVNQMKLSKKSDMLAAEPNSQLHHLELQTLNSIDESDNESVEVRVCDICGDIGREALLATCSTCGDGAEHTYCMQVMLTEVPRDWICEECMMDREKEKPQYDKLDKGERKYKRTLSLNEPRKMSEKFGFFNSQSYTQLNDKSKLQKITSADSVSKKSLTELKAVSKTSRKTKERRFELSRESIHYNERKSHKNSSMIDLDKWKIKSANGLTASGQYFTSRTVEGASSSAGTVHRAERLQQTPELVPGSLVKSKSFSGIDSKVSSQFQREKVMAKSMSFNRISSKCLKNSAVKSLKRLRQEKECNQMQKRLKPDMHSLLPRKSNTGSDPSISESCKVSPLMRSPKIGASASRLKNDKSNVSAKKPSGLPTSKFEKRHYAFKAEKEKINLSKTSQIVSSGITVSKTDKMKLPNSSSKVGSCPTSKTCVGELLTSSAMSYSGGRSSNAHHAKSLPPSPVNVSSGLISKTGYGNLSRSMVPTSSTCPRSKTNKGKLSICTAMSGSCVPTSKTSKGNISISLPMTQSGVSMSTYRGKALMSSPMSASAVSSSNNCESTPKINLSKDVSASMTHERASSIDTRVTKITSSSSYFDSKVAAGHGKSYCSSKGDGHLINKGLNNDKNQVFSDLRQHDHSQNLGSAVKERNLCGFSPDENLSRSGFPVTANSNFASMTRERASSIDTRVTKITYASSCFNSKVAAGHGKSNSSSEGDGHLIQKGPNCDKNQVFSDLRQHDHSSDLVSGVKESNLCGTSPDENLSSSVSPVTASSISASTTHERASSIDMRVKKITSASSYFDSKVAAGHEKSNCSSEGDWHLIQKGLNRDKSQVFSDPRQHDHSPDSGSADKERNLCGTSPDENLSCSVFPASANSYFAAPQFDRIWLGDFDIYKCEKLPRFSGGIQAHLSTNASPKAVEAVHKFPKNLLLQEVPRTSIWPTQFFKNQATEDNIALFFFAENIESFTKTYKNLVHCMVDNDLALKGNFGEFDLLIFSSNLLPERSHRWNGLLFIWGVFKAKSLQFQSSEHIVSSAMTIETSSSDVVSVDINVSILGTEYKSGALSNHSESIETSEFQQTSRNFTLQQSSTVTSDKKLSGPEAYIQQQICAKSLGGSALRSMINSQGKSKLLSKVAPESDATLSTLHSVHLKDGENQQECGVSRCEFSSPGKEPYSRVMFPLCSTENEKNDEENPTREDSDNKMNVENEMSASLSLSIEVPCSSKNQFSDSNTSRKMLSTEESGVDTPVYLFGKILKS